MKNPIFYILNGDETLLTLYLALMYFIGVLVGVFSSDYFL